MSTIALLFTGGTIGCVVHNGKADPAAESNRLLVAHFRRTYPACAVEFRETEPLSTLSENMTIPKWNRLLEALRQADSEEVDGIVITHGTDTLAYTAALLDLMWTGKSTPIILVSSHTPPTDPQANGHRQFGAAVEAILTGQARGVTAALELPPVVFPSEENPTACASQSSPNMGPPPGTSPASRESDRRQEPVRLIPGHQLTQCQSLTDRFGWVPARDWISPAVPLIDSDVSLSPCVLLVHPYPGMDMRSLNLPDGTRAVVYELYHSGTACVEGMYTGIGSLLARCAARDIPLFVCSTPAADAAYRYTSTSTMLKREAAAPLPLSGITIESAYALLLTAASRTDTSSALITAVYALLG